MRRMPYPLRGWLATAGLTTALLLASAGCGGDSDGDLPDAAELLPAAADRMAAVETARLAVETDTDVSDMPVRRVEGVITRVGDAEGTAQLDQLGLLVELSFVVVGDTFYFQLIGGWQDIPLSQASTLYDPSAILDPDRGVANLLRTAQDATVDGRESVAGVDAYRVDAELDGATLGTLLPGVTESAPGTLWIGVDEPLLHQIEITLPAADEESEQGAATVRLSDFDAPVDISAP